MTTRTRAAVAALLALPGLLALAPTAAQAQVARDSVTLEDPADATGSGVDIGTVELERTDRGLTARIEVADLRKDGSAGMSYYVDLDRERRGPELVLNAGLFFGTDYVLVGADGWQDTAGEPLECSYRLRLKYRQDVVKVRIGEDCLDDADRVRVALSTGDDTDPSHPIIDWLGKRRSWSPWLTAA